MASGLVVHILLVSDKDDPEHKTRIEKVSSSRQNIFFGIKSPLIEIQYLLKHHLKHFLGNVLVFFYNWKFSAFRETKRRQSTGR